LNIRLLSFLYGLPREEIAIIVESLEEKTISGEVADDAAVEE